MEFKLYIDIQQQNNFQINQARLKYRSPWQNRTINNGMYDMLIVIDLGHLKAETLRISHTNQNASY